MSHRALGGQFNIRNHGPWYHGAPRADFTELAGSARFNMPEYLHGHTYATTDRSLAEDYAREAHASYLKEHPEEADNPEVAPTVYEVNPTRSWEPDPHSGPSGWYDGPSRSETKDILREGGGGVSVGFPNPVRIKGREKLEP